jgi:predicted  nucleic acid-binding Zn ribbon protein
MHTHESVADSNANPPCCPACKRTMLLSGIEWDTEVRDLYTFACDDCAQREIRSVLAA